MAHGILLGPEKRFFWNVDSHVGQGCPNKPDDVQLVQFGYYCMARNPAANLTPQEKAAYKTIVPGAPYSGAANDPLTIAIKAHQASRGGTQDGRVSPIQNASGSYGEKAWMIVPLVNNIKDVNRQVWPNIQKAHKCPSGLAAVAEKTFS